MDKGDLFYLIFAVIAAAISIYRGIKKKRTAEAEAASTAPSVPEAYEEDEDDWLLPVEQYVQPEPIRQPEVTPRTAPRNFASMRIKPIEPETNDDEPQYERPDMLNDADEVRKALIYAEILNRKY